MTEAVPGPTNAREDLLAVGASALEYATWPGRRPGPTLVLLHEGLGSVAMWRDFPQTLSAATGLPVFC